MQAYSTATKSWATGEAHAAQSQAINMRGLIVGLSIPISEVTANPTVAVTFRDADGAIIIPDALCATLADGTNHYKVALSHKASPDAEFNPAPVDGPITISIDPSADAGGLAQTLTVKVRVFCMDNPNL